MSKKCVTHRLASSVRKASLLAIILLVKELAKCLKRYHTEKKPLLHMGPKDNDMTRYWQYYVGQTIQEHLFILKVGESSKTVPEGQILCN